MTKNIKPIELHLESVHLGAYPQLHHPISNNQKYPQYNGDYECEVVIKKNSKAHISIQEMLLNLEQEAGKITHRIKDGDKCEDENNKQGWAYRKGCIFFKARLKGDKTNPNKKPMLINEDMLPAEDGTMLPGTRINMTLLCGVATAHSNTVYFAIRVIQRNGTQFGLSMDGVGSTGPSTSMFKRIEIDGNLTDGDYGDML